MNLTKSRWIALWPLATLALASHAADPRPEGVVNLSASAQMEVANDVMSVTFSTSRDGNEASAVQAALKQALDAALSQARAAAAPGQLDVRTGRFSLFPRHSGKGVITGWSGTAELIVEGRDLPAITQLAGRIESLTISRVAYGLSPQQREQVQAGVTADAIARFRTRAADYARQFGYSSYALREVHVATDEGPARPLAMARAQAMDASAPTPLPVEPGTGTVTATVSGSVQLMR